MYGKAVAPVNEIRAIETAYKGYRFRSRLEARWAVFFDALGIPWEYEAEGFNTSAGPYLPDFRIFGNLFAEVKPPAVEKHEPKRWQTFVEETGHSLVLLVDVPAEAWYPVMLAIKEGPRVAVECDCGGHAGSRWTFEWLDFAASSAKGRPWFAFCGPSRPPDRFLQSGGKGADAVSAARGARFEHGESGAPAPAPNPAPPPAVRTPPAEEVPEAELRVLGILMGGWPETASLVEALPLGDLLTHEHALAILAALKRLAPNRGTLDFSALAEPLDVGAGVLSARLLLEESPEEARPGDPSRLDRLRKLLLQLRIRRLEESGAALSAQIHRAEESGATDGIASLLDQRQAITGECLQLQRELRAPAPGAKAPA